LVVGALPSPVDFSGALLRCSAPASRPQPPAERENEERELSTLMRAAQRGDRVAYAQLVRKVMPLLQRVLRIRRGFLQSADRDDIMQDVLLSLHRSMPSYDPQREFVPWLLTIARNKMADQTRRFARSKANEVLVNDLSEFDAIEPSASYVERRGELDTARKAIARLSPLQQRAIELFRVRQLTSKEAATIMGTTPGALRVSIHRAMNSLRASLGDARTA
jgi:RNA polymerase sigma-70 factor (ECF subfamily)